VLVYAIALLAAVLVVPLTKGSFRVLAHMPIARGWMLFAGLGLQIGLDYLDLPRARYDDVGLAILLASYVLIIGFAFSNLRLGGMAIILIGISLNAVVIALNAGMPYTAPAGERAEVTVKHRPEKPNDVLPVLSDRIAIGDPFNVAMSFGDIIIAAGLIDLCYQNSRRKRHEAVIDESADVEVDLAMYERVLADEGGRSTDDNAVERIEHAGVVDVPRT
jgi:hypothetical protein